jgi:protein SCO1/2
MHFHRSRSLAADVRAATAPDAGAGAAQPAGGACAWPRRGARQAPDRLRRLLLAVAWLVAAHPACAGAPLSGKDVTASHLGGVLGLADQRGRLRRLEDFRGKAVLLFFGYTRCPDVCPTTLLRMAEVVRQLGPDGRRVQVLWMTVDPERDTQALLANYLGAFDPSFLGLRGTPAQTDAVTRAFEVRYDITTYKDEVLVSHSVFGYLIDGRGRTRVKIAYEATPEQIAHDVREVIAGPREGR